MPVFTVVNASAFVAGRQGFLCDTPGGGLRIVTGVNTRLVRTAALVAGTLLVANNSVTAATRFFLTHVGSAVGNMGHLYVSAIVAGVSFTITSNNGADTDTVDVLMVESA